MGKSSRQTTGYWYPLIFQHKLGLSADAMLEVRGGKKAAWKGELTVNGTINIDARNLFGGEKDQGGIVGQMEVMFGGATQLPNAYLVANVEASVSSGYSDFWTIVGGSVTGSLNPTPTPTPDAKIAAYRGFTTVVWKGGYWGANNPYPQPASYKIRRIAAAMAEVGNWYLEKASITETPALVTDRWQHVEMSCDGDLVRLFVGGRLAISAPIDFVPNGGIGGQSTIGRYSALPSDGGEINAYLRNVRVTKAVRHTADFVPSRAVPSGINDPLWAQTVMSLPMRDSVTVDDKGNPWTLYDDDAEISGDLTFDGSPAALFHGGNVRTPYTAALNIGSHFTVDYWVKPVQLTGNVICVNQLDAQHAGYTAGILSTGKMQAYFGRNYWPSDGVIITENTAQKLISINPAHWLYYLRTHDAVGREPTANMNDASWRAAADQLYSEGFGICVEYDPDKESLEEHEQRICKLIGGSVSRSAIDGQYYLDLARGNYDIDDLPILTDDDVLEFKELPSVLDGAVNSVSVKYFDPERKEDIITPPDADLGLVDAFGMIHQVNEYPEIPTAALAGRISHRDRLDSTLPTRAFDLVTNRTPYGWRQGTYFRLQLPKRSIADMVCILGEKQSGTLRSGAIKAKATQDIYNLPAASFVEVESGGGTNVPQIATPITLQLAFEAPYTEAAQRLPRAELAALPEDVGYLQAVAADLVGQRDYTMMVADAGGEYVEASNGAWCPVAETGAAYGRTETVIQLGAAIGLAEVAIGSAGLWDDEIVRVDAKDMEAGTMTLGRACADTTPARHDPATRIWFYDNGAAIDTTEYTDGETVDVKLLSNTASQQLLLGDATAMPVTFDQRIARPYPPAQVRINTEADPVYLFGELTVTWVHRDRLLPADQLVDTEAATIGPEAGTTYTMRTYVDDVLDDTQAGIAGITAPVTPSADGLVRIEIEAVRDGLASWQAQVREFEWTASELPALQAEDGELITTESDDPIYLE